MSSIALRANKNSSQKSKTTTVVIDTGVLVSAALFTNSQPARALRLAFSNCRLLISTATMDELENVFSRNKFDRYAPIDFRLLFAALYRERADLVVVESVVLDCAAPKDNKFLALALDGGADIVLASDAHLTVMNPWRGIDICTPAQFLIKVAVS